MDTRKYGMEERKRAKREQRNPRIGRWFKEQQARWFVERDALNVKIAERDLLIEKLNRRIDELR